MDFNALFGLTDTAEKKTAKGTAKKESKKIRKKIKNANFMD